MEEKNKYLSSKLSTAELKELLSRENISIDDMLEPESGFSFGERNQIALIYYNEQKYPFLLGHKVKFPHIASEKNSSPVIINGILVGIYVINKDIDINKRYIYGEDTGEIYYVDNNIIVYPTKRVNCHPEIKECLERFVNDESFDSSLLFVPKIIEHGINNESSNGGEIPVGYMKPKLFTREDTRIPWYELVDTSQPLFRQIESLFRLFTTFEDEEDVLPIIVSASCQPSAISSHAQISVFYGLSGTGKSACCHLVEGLYNIPKVLSISTYASFRNHVEQHRHLVSAEYTGERNIHVVIDEINDETLASNEFYTLLKGGVSIVTAEVTITNSEKSGTNKTFNCFCPKSFSTCKKFWQHEKYNEIQRRILIFETQRVSDGDFLSKEEINYNECSPKLSIVLQNFWVEKQEDYKKIVRKLRGQDRDILATICCLYDLTPEEAKEKLNKFRNLTREKTQKPDASTEYLDKFLEFYIYRAASDYIKAKHEHEIEDPEQYIKVKVSDLTTYFKQGAALGLFERSLADNKNVADMMISRGYELKHTREGGLLSGESWFWIKEYDPE